MSCKELYYAIPQMNLKVILVLGLYSTRFVHHFDPTSQGVFSSLLETCEVREVWMQQLGTEEPLYIGYREGPGFVVFHKRGA